MFAVSFRRHLLPQRSRQRKPAVFVLTRLSLCRPTPLSLSQAQSVETSLLTLAGMYLSGYDVQDLDHSRKGLGGLRIRAVIVD